MSRLKPKYKTGDQYGYNPDGSAHYLTDEELWRVNPYSTDKYGNHVFMDNDGNYHSFVDGKDEILEGYDPDAVYGASDYSLWDYLSFDGNAWGALWDDLTGRTADEMSFRNQNLLLDREQEFALEQQQREMDYNSEVAQMERLKAAGLNPALLGNMSGSSISSGSSPSAPAVNSRFDPMRMVSGLGELRTSIANSRAQRDNLDSQTRLNNIEANWKPMEKDAQIKLWNTTSEKYAKEAGLADEDAKWIAAQREFFQITSEERKEQLQADINKAISEYDKIRQETKNLEKESANIEKQGQVLDATVRNINADTTLKGAEVNYYNESAEAVESEGQLAAQQKLMLSQQYEAAENYLNGIPLSTDGHQVIHMLLSSDKTEDNEKGQKLLDGVLKCASDEYDQNVQNQWQNAWKNFGLQMMNSVPNMMPSFNVVATPGMRGKRK